MNSAAKTRKKNKREEAQFETELHRGAEFGGFARVPIPDSVPMRRPDGSRGSQNPKVYDLGLLKDGLYHAIELKQTGSQTLPASSFKPHQLPQLRRAYENGAMSWVGCLFHDTSRRWREVWFAWSEHVWRSYEGGMDSVSYVWFRRWGIQLPKIKAPVLDTKTFEAKIPVEGREVSLARSWDFRPAHQSAREFLGALRGSGAVLKETEEGS